MSEGYSAESGRGRPQAREPLRVTIDDVPRTSLMGVEGDAASIPPPAISIAPPAISIAPPSISIAPPAISIAPPSISIAPPSISVAPPSGDEGEAPAEPPIEFPKPAPVPSEVRPMVASVVTQRMVSVVSAPAPAPVAAQVAPPAAAPVAAHVAPPTSAPRSIPPPPPPEAMRTPSVPPPAVLLAAPTVPLALDTPSAVPDPSDDAGPEVTVDASAALDPGGPVGAIDHPDDDETEVEDAEFEMDDEVAPPPAQAKPLVSGRPPAPPAAAAAPPPPVPPPTAAQERARKTRNWFETFFDDAYLRTVAQPSPRAVVREVDFIEKSLALGAGSRVLDVGSGLGLQANELARRGHVAIGIDRSKAMVRRAKEDASDLGVESVFLQGDMREMTFDFQFDAIVCWGTTYGYFEDEVNRLVLVRMRDALREGGRLLLEVANRDFVVKSQPNLVWFEGDGCICMEESQFNATTSVLEVNRNVMLDEGRGQEVMYSVRLYSLHELQRDLEQFGFRVLQVSGAVSTPGVFFGADAPRIIILAERKANSMAVRTPAPAVRTSLPPPAG